MLLWLSPFLVVCLLLACWFRAAGIAGAAQLRASALSATELVARATTCTLRGYRVGRCARSRRLRAAPCAVVVCGWLACVAHTGGAVDRARVVFLNILAFGLCVLVAQWIRHRPTEPGIAGSSPAGVISKA